MFAACGSTTSTDLFGGAGAAAAADAGVTSDDAGAGAGDAAAEDGGGGADAGGTGDAGAVDAGPKRSCADLAQDVENLRPKAVECSLVSLDPQCDLLIDDVCCKATIDKVQKGTPQVKAFQVAVAVFKAAKCVPQCSAAPCRSEPSRFCVPQGLGATCQQ